jgi:uncharacterized membrane protein YqiK
MPDYPRPCPKCGALTEREGFSVDRHAPSGRKALCRECDRKKAHAYYEAHKDEMLAQRVAAREAAYEAEIDARIEENRANIEAVRRAGLAAQARQDALLERIEAERGIRIRA